MSHSPSSAPTKGLTDVGLIALAGLVASAGVTWGAGWCTIRLAGHKVPKGSALDGLRAFAHFGHPERAWRVPVGPVWLYWALTVLALSLAVSVAWVLWRIWRSASHTNTQRADI